MTAASSTTAQLYDCRKAFAETLEALAERDERIVVVVNDSIGSSNVGGFAKRWPERLINVGIAEQNMIGVAAGLANGGKIPFVCGAACFLTGRALEQIKADLAYSRANVKLCGMASGVAYGELGPTHHSIEDYGWLRTMGGVKLVVPSDPWETGEAIKTAAATSGPYFVRISRMGVPMLNHADRIFNCETAEVMHDGNDVAIIANGVMVSRALAAARALEGEGIRARVVSLACLSPLDENVIVEAAKTGAIVTVEEHSVRGGLGGAVAEVVAAKSPCRMRMLGFPGFLPTGSASWLMEHYGLTAEGIAVAARDLAVRK
jgi:transketolase